MTNCNRQGVRLVRGRGLGVEREDHANHPLHLSLVGSAVAANGLLDSRRRVLGALDSGRGGRNQGGAARLTDEERDTGVGADKRLLERHSIRLVLGHEL